MITGVMGKGVNTSYTLYMPLISALLWVFCSVFACILAAPIVRADAIPFEPPHTLTFDALAAEYQVLRSIHGHFDGSAWNPVSDKWGGRKHQIMAELSSRLADKRAPCQYIIDTLGEPDEVIVSGNNRFDVLNQKAQIKASAAYLVYYWRKQHDFLYFACDEENIQHVDWWHAGE